MDKAEALRALGGLYVPSAREGMTQERLAWMIGSSSKAYVSRIEAGSENVSVGVLCKMAEALGCKVRDLIDF